MREGALDMIVFSSSSTVNNLAQIVAPLSLPQALAGTSVACIGPITAETCHQLGLKVSVQPASYDIPSLVEAIRIFYS
jgi:uroporphyrinogen-III synthase